jgi:hypothetical protein
MAKLINTRSPFYIKVYHASLFEAKLQLYIYEGVKDTSPDAADLKYTIQKAELEGNNYVVFEISQLVRDYIETKYDGEYDSYAVWVNPVVTAFDTSGGTLSSPTVTPSDYTSQFIATDGYGYFEEGINPDFDEGLMMSEGTIYRVNDRSVNIPVSTETANSVSFLLNGETVYSKLIDYADPANPTTSEAIQYIASDSNSTADSYKERVLEDGGVFEDNSLLQAFEGSFDIGAVDEVYVNYYKEVTLGTATSTTSNKLVDSLAQFTNTASSSYFIRNLTDNTIAQITAVDSDTTLSLSSDIMASGENYEMSRTITHVLKVKTFDCSKYEPIRVTFVNKYGALQDLYFTRRSNESLNIKKQDYKASVIDFANFSYDTSEHQMRTLNLVGNESITLNTDYIDESCNEHIRQLMLSEQVWMTRLTDEEKVVPLKLKSNSLQIKKKVNDKLIQYTMKFDVASDKINNIR